MKFLVDFLPIILFFGAFKYADAHAEWAARFTTEHLGFMVSGGVVGVQEAPVLLATIVVIVATAVQIATMLVRRKKIDMMLWVTFVLVVVLGGATIWFHNATFIKWKPSVLYWVMALAFWLSQSVFGKNLLKAMIGEQLQLPEPVWQRLNLAWVVFFLSMGVLNLYVAYNYSTSTWASFKAFGATGLMIVFMVGQGFYLNRHIKPDDPAAPDASPVPVPVSSERAVRKESLK